jgi:cell division septation protein DedD
MARHGGTGSIVGTVFADWNANGLQDPGDTALENIPIRLANLGNATTARSGEFAFVHVPIGLQQVGIDLTSLPVDFDPPAVPQVQLELARGESKTLTFGLVPLGSVSGRVIHDANANGRADLGEPSIDGAVLTLNGGARSEAVRRGSFRFDAVRSGEHTLELLAESLPEGATVVGSRSVKVTLGPDALLAQTEFVVRIQERPEIRRLFRPGGSSARAPAADARAPRREPALPGPASPRRTTRSAEAIPDVTTTVTNERFVVQVAALNDPIRAHRLVEQLHGEGLSSYLAHPPASDPEAPYRVRVGPFTTRAAAQKAARVLEEERGGKMWVVRER